MPNRRASSLDALIFLARVLFYTRRAIEPDRRSDPAKLQSALNSLKFALDHPITRVRRARPHRSRREFLARVFPSPLIKNRSQLAHDRAADATGRNGAVLLAAHAELGARHFAPQKIRAQGASPAQSDDDSKAVESLRCDNENHPIPGRSYDFFFERVHRPNSASPASAPRSRPSARPQSSCTPTRSGRSRPSSTP